MEKSNIRVYEPVDDEVILFQPSFRVHYIRMNFKESDDKRYITKKELYNMDIRDSNVIECIIKDGDEPIEIKKQKNGTYYYKGILLSVLYHMVKEEQIGFCSNFNFKTTNEKGKKGYWWDKKLRLSIQNQESQRTLKEIIEKVKEMKLTINISIRLKSNRIIHFKME